MHVLWNRCFLSCSIWNISSIYFTHVIQYQWIWWQFFISCNFHVLSISGTRPVNFLLRKYNHTWGDRKTMKILHTYQDLNTASLKGTKRYKVADPCDHCPWSKPSISMYYKRNHMYNWKFCNLITQPAAIPCNAGVDEWRKSQIKCQLPASWESGAHVQKQPRWNTPYIILSY